MYACMRTYACMCLWYLDVDQVSCTRECSDYDWLLSQQVRSRGVNSESGAFERGEF